MGREDFERCLMLHHHQADGSISAEGWGQCSVTGLGAGVGNVRGLGAKGSDESADAGKYVSDGINVNEFTITHSAIDWKLPNWWSYEGCQRG